MRTRDRRASLSPYSTSWNMASACAFRILWARARPAGGLAQAQIGREGGSEPLVRRGGAAALAVGWASGRHGEPRESRRCRSVTGAVALPGSLDPRASEQRARHHGQKLERVAGRRVDDRIVSAGRSSRGPLGGLGWPGS